ncbi:hypothetical protein PsYK624_141160 [Phanerochaete sordida]|uniref:Uncharacterized protein n=1 Tax=Phanerochaete sordida TaxID=48140 RepID=A0A9P3GR32_9APHY|nr:hypothetical protein PsYK624_141160 [Phanerochaete sordida]
MPREARFATDFASLDIARAHLPYPAFPRLCYLKFTQKFLRLAHIIFLHSRLESATIYCIGNEEGFASFLRKAQTTAPNVLESLDGWYYPLTREALTCLSNRPRLRALSLLVHQFNMRIWDLPYLNKVTSLTSLKLAFAPGIIPTEWTRFLRSLDSAPLERIWVVVWAPQECPSTKSVPFLEALGQFTHLSACEATITSGAEQGL